MFRKVKRLIFTLVFCFGCFSTIYGQDQVRADSLKQNYRLGDYDMSEFKILTLITESETNPDSVFLYADLLIQKANSFESEGKTLEAYIYGYLARGNAYFFKRK